MPFLIFCPSHVSLCVNAFNQRSQNSGFKSVCDLLVLKFYLKKATDKKRDKKELDMKCRLCPGQRHESE